MRWQGRRQSDNVEDRRSEGGGLPGGFGRGGGFRIPTGPGIRTARGGGLSGILILVVLFFALKACGIDPLQVLVGDGGVGPATQQTGQRSAPTAQQNDEMTQFVKTVLAETEDVWGGIFQANGATYPDPTLVLFNGQVRSACGFASSASGPFYCPGDKKLYIDLDFYNELANRFGAAGDFAQAYVIAHEVGHHVQTLLGISQSVHAARGRQSPAEANAMSVRLELQADCFAGVWAHHADRVRGIVESGDLEEALNAASAIGDDRLQRQGRGYVSPDSFTHGTSAQRARWFRRGFSGGDPQACDTFAADQP